MRTQKPPLLDRIAYRVDNIPRFSRIMLNIAFSIVVIAVISIPLLYLFAQDANELESGEILYTPTIITAVLWLIIYGLGWWALVGFDWGDEPWKAGKPASWVVIVGVIALFFLILEIIFALLFGFVL